MYELCRLLAPKKVAKVRAVRKLSVRVGVKVDVIGRDCVVVRRDNRFANAWFVSHNGVELPHSFGRDMLVVR